MIGYKLKPHERALIEEFNQNNINISMIICDYKDFSNIIDYESLMLNIYKDLREKLEPIRLDDIFNIIVED